MKNLKDAKLTNHPYPEVIWVEDLSSKCKVLGKTKDFYIVEGEFGIIYLVKEAKIIGGKSNPYEKWTITELYPHAFVGVSHKKEISVFNGKDFFSGKEAFDIATLDKSSKLLLMAWAIIDESGKII